MTSRGKNVLEFRRTARRENRYHYYEADETNRSSGKREWRTRWGKQPMRDEKRGAIWGISTRAFATSSQSKSWAYQVSN